ncbi:MAG: hypothetical protein JXB30_12255 [Anaerolineae bacterium]|nr:hypothetical protein [Anaerolineae bacterium]
MSQAKCDQGLDGSSMDSGWRNLYRVGGVAAWIVTGLFLAALFLIVVDIQAVAFLEDNFLILLFKLHAGFGGVREELLEGFSPLDSVIVALVGMMFLALYPILKRVSKVWAIAAVSLPFIGLGLFLITQDIGRSGILAAGLITSSITLRSSNLNKGTAFVGLVASISLLAGDIGTAFGYSGLLAVFIGVGYVLFMVWCALIGWRLLPPGRIRLT